MFKSDYKQRVIQKCIEKLDTDTSYEDDACKVAYDAARIAFIVLFVIITLVLLCECFLSCNMTLGADIKKQTVASLLLTMLANLRKRRVQRKCRITLNR